jgi:hypothetical protein
VNRLPFRLASLAGLLLICLVVCSSSGCHRRGGDDGGRDEVGAAPGKSADALMNELRQVVKEHDEAQARGDVKRAAELERKVDELMAELDRLPDAEVARAIARDGERFRDITGVGPEPSKLLQMRKAKMAEGAGSAGNPDARGDWREEDKRRARVIVELDRGHISTARDLTRQLQGTVSEIDELQGLLWGAERDKVFVAQWRQPGWDSSFKAYDAWCGGYRRPVSPTKAEAAELVKVVDRLAMIGGEGQATPADQARLVEVIDLAGGERGLGLGYRGGEPKTPYGQAPPLEQSPLIEMRSQLRTLHETVRRMRGYTGKRADPPG